MTNRDKKLTGIFVRHLNAKWIKNQFLFVELKRWFWQLLMMVGAVPYTFVSLVILSFGGRIALDELPPFLAIVSIILWLGPYYLLSIFLHFRTDRFLPFQSKWWLSPRLYFTALFAFPWIGLMFFEVLLRPYTDYFQQGGLWVLHILLGSVVLTWLLSEWLCRFLTRYEIKSWRIYRRVV
jgi:hypothetical protein